MYKNMPMPKPFSAEIVYFCNMSIVRAKKSLGQHFLRDQNIARKITDSLLPVTRDILEIGPGMGVLTRHLFANPAFSVRAIDIDQESIDYLHQELPEYQDRDYRIFEEFAFYMMKEACEKRTTNILDISGKKYAFDSTTIPLCLATFPWAKFRSKIGRAHV